MKLSEITLFQRKDSHAYMQQMINDYISFFQKCGYKKHNSVKISSGIDPSVHLIGSHISVLKPYFLNGTLPEPGYVMTQPCVRTRNLKKYNDELFYPNWGSMFHSLGTVARPEHLLEVTEQTVLFLHDVWDIRPEDIKVRISSDDKDLMKVAEKVVPSVAFETDTMPPVYYRHKLGVPGVWGRNFNFALRDGCSDNFADIGNVIILENKDKQLGIEIALGTSTIMKLNKGLPHILDCHPLIGFEEINPPSLRIKIEDCIITSMALYNDGVEPSNAHIANRLMKKYMDILKESLPKTYYSESKINDILSRYERLEFGHEKAAFTQKMIGYIKQPHVISHHKNSLTGKQEVRQKA